MKILCKAVHSFLDYTFSLLFWQCILVPLVEDKATWCSNTSSPFLKSREGEFKWGEWQFRREVLFKPPRHDRSSPRLLQCNNMELDPSSAKEGDILIIYIRNR